MDDKNKFNIIRGKRVEDQLDDLEAIFEQSSYNNLEQNVLKFIPVSAKRQHAVDPIRIVSLTTLPYIGTKNLDIAAVASSEGTNYNPRLVFNNVVFEEEDLPTNVTVKAKDGEEYHMQPINLADNTLRVRCDCLDFYWRFAAFNAKDKSLIGSAPTAYQRKSNRGPANPQEVPGVCKHIIATVKALKHSGMVK